MSRWRRRGPLVPPDVRARADLQRATRVLAACSAADGTWLLGTRDALLVVPPEGEARTLPWERVESADWDRDEDRLRVVGVGEYGHPKPTRVLTVADDDPSLFLQLLRERVTASVVLQRRVVVSGKRGLTVIARRSPAGANDLTDLTWAYELDPGLDPDDPEVQRLADAGVRAAAEELGLG